MTHHDNDNEYFIPSCGNIFADLGLDHSDKLYNAAKVASDMDDFRKRASMIEADEGSMINVTRLEFTSTKD